MDFFHALQDFVIHLKIFKNVSPRTLEQYERHLYYLLAHYHPEIFKYDDKKIDHFSHLCEPTPSDKEELAKYGKIRRFLEKTATTSVKDITLEHLKMFRLTLVQK